MQEAAHPVTAKELVEALKSDYPSKDGKALNHLVWGVLCSDGYRKNPRFEKQERGKWSLKKVS